MLMHWADHSEPILEAVRGYCFTAQWDKTRAIRVRLSKSRYSQHEKHMCSEWAKEVVQVMDVMETRAPRNGIEFVAQIGKSRIGEQYIYLY